MMVGVNGQYCSAGRFEGSRNARKIRDKPLPGLLVEPFDIPALTFRDRAVQIDQKQFVADNLGYQLPMCIQRGDEATDTKDVLCSQKAGYVARTPDVLGTVFP